MDALSVINRFWLCEFIRTSSLYLLVLCYFKRVQLELWSETLTYCYEWGTLKIQEAISLNLAMVEQKKKRNKNAIWITSFHIVFNVSMMLPQFRQIDLHSTFYAILRVCVYIDLQQYNNAITTFSLRKIDVVFGQLLASGSWFRREKNACTISFRDDAEQKTYNEFVIQ